MKEEQKGDHVPKQGSPEEHQDRHEERLEVAVSVDVGVVIDGHFPKHLRGQRENRDPAVFRITTT